MPDLEEAYYAAFAVYIDLFPPQDLRKSGHCHHCAAYCDDESCSCREADFTDRDFEICRPTLYCCVVGEDIWVFAMQTGRFPYPGLPTP